MMMNNSKSKDSENFRMKIVFLPESTKTQEWLIKLKSDQLECLKLKEQFIRSSAEKCNDLAPEDKTELDKYVHIHQELVPLKQDIEANAFKINTQMLSKVKTQFFK